MSHSVRGLVFSLCLLLLLLCLLTPRPGPEQREEPSNKEAARFFSNRNNLLKVLAGERQDIHHQTEYRLGLLQWWPVSLLPLLPPPPASLLPSLSLNTSSATRRDSQVGPLSSSLIKPSNLFSSLIHFYFK